MIASEQRYRLLVTLVSCALALLYPLVVTGNARADDSNPAAGSALNGALQAADAATGAGGVDTATAPDQPVPAATNQQSSTGQAAGASAAATQQQPGNLVVSIRINSPGNDGPISQTNVAGSVAGASNDSSTGQGATPGAGQASQQQATTDQAATTAAAATQERPQNIVIIVRINSPGDNGPIEQTNTAVAVSNAGNASVTTQGGSGSGGAEGMPTGASPDPRAPTGPPATQATASAPAEALPRMSVALPAPAAPRTSVAPGRRIDRPAPAAGTGHRPAGDRTSSAPSSSQIVSSEPADPPVAVSSAAREPLARVKAPRRSAAARAESSASRDPGVSRRAVDLLGQLAPRSPVRASGSEKDVTNAVVLTLIAVLGAFLVFIGSTYLASGVRFDARSWRQG